MKPVIDDTANSAPTPRVKLLQTQWLNPRGLRLWVIVTILLYTLMGFFLLPHLVKRSLIGFIENDLGRSARIEKVAFNPYALKLDLQGFELADADSTKLLGFATFTVNFELSSLFNWAWTFDAINLADIYIYSERLNTEESRWQQLLETLADEEQITRPDQSRSGLPRLLIHNLSINRGRVALKDNVPTTPVDIHLGPVDIAVSQLSTLQNREGQQVVTIKLPDNASLNWEGRFALAPFNSEGILRLQNLRLDKITAYLQGQIPLNEINATLSSHFRYRVHASQVQDKQTPVREPEIEALIDQLDIVLDDLSVEGLNPASKFLSISQLALQGGVLQYPLQKLKFSKLSIDSPDLVTWLDSNGKLNLEQLIPATNGKVEQPRKHSSDRAPWQIAIDELAVINAQLNFSDQSMQPQANIGIENFNLKLNGLSNLDGALFPFRLTSELAPEGEITLEGELGLFPEFSLQTTSQLKNIPLAIGQAYVQRSAMISIGDGSLNSNLDIAIGPESTFTAKGNIQIPNLDIKSLADKKPLAGWNKLDIDDFNLDLQANTLKLSTLVFAQPYSKLVIYKDRSTNISDLMVEPEEKSDAEKRPATETTKPIKVALAGIEINDGALDFSDLSLPLPFSTHVGQLNGNISTLATDGKEPTKIKLKGQINEYGLAHIRGTISPLDPIKHTDIGLEFLNLKLPHASPYSAQFAGRKIDEGKLDLKLQYRINKGLLAGENDVVLSDLSLGETIDHPEAIDLPLDLAIALLKDGDGLIKANLPVSGDVNNPEFKIGGVVWGAFVTLVKKAISSPFKLLGALVGVDSDDFGQVQFMAGRADLSPPELEKIALLQKALTQRPELNIEVAGITSPKIDIPALKLAQLSDAVNQQLNDGADINANQLTLDHYSLSENKVRKILETLFRKRFPEIRLKSLKSEHRKPPPDNPEGRFRLDELAYASDLRDRLQDSEIITEMDLSNLAQARASVVKAALLGGGELDTNRVLISEPGETEAGNDQWVALDLAVTGQ